jgi:cephalosporin-C deacetylase-like acetyl esterase
VNFARKIENPVIMSVGFIDRTCAPNSVCAAYHVIAAPKRIFYEPTMGHSQSKRYSEFLNRWLAGQLGLDAKVPPTR